MKKSIYILMPLFIMTVLGGCASNIIKYENALADLDITTRVQICLFVANKKQDTLYTVSELQTIIEDIHQITTNNSAEKEINDHYINSAENLLYYLDNHEKKYYDIAFSEYVVAQEKFDKYRVSDYE